MRLAVDVTRRCRSETRLAPGARNLGSERRATRATSGAGRPGSVGRPGSARRFTDEEQLAFGSRRFGTVLSRRFGHDVPFAKGVEEPKLFAEQPPRGKAVSLASPSRARCGLPQLPGQDVQPLDEEMPVRAVLTRMLPARQSLAHRQPLPTPGDTVRLPKPLRPVAGRDGLRRSRSTSLPCLETTELPLLEASLPSDAPPSPGKKKLLLEGFRQKLLQQHRSVHEGFAKFDAAIIKDRSLSLEEFRRAAARMGLVKSVDLIFEIIDADGSGTVSTNEWIMALIDMSPEALLWELRCALDKHGIRFNNAHKAFERIRVHDLQMRRIDIEDQDALHSLQDLPDGRQSLRLRRSEWMKLGLAVGLTVPCTERLFEVVDADASGAIDLQEMFEALRAAAPFVSFEGFVTKVLMRYGSIQEAFAQHARDGRIGQHQFLELAKSLDVRDQNAEMLWSRCRDREVLARCEASGEDFMRQADFVQQLLAWAPDTALDTLRSAIAEQFGGVKAARSALLKAGLPRTGPLSISDLDAALRSLGLKGCDARLILSAMGGMREDTLGVAPGVSLDDLMGALRRKGKARRTAGAVSSCSPFEVIASAMGPYWQQLNAVKNDIRQGIAG